MTRFDFQLFIVPRIILHLKTEIIE